MPVSRIRSRRMSALANMVIPMGDAKVLPFTLFLHVQLIAGDDILPTASQDLDSQDAAPGPSEHVPNQYEVQRQRNIERNKQMLLGLKGRDPVP